MDTLEVERRLLGACLLHPPVARQVAAQVKPEEIIHAPFRAMYDAMLSATERDAEFDDATVLRRMVQSGVEEQTAADTILLALGSQTFPHAIGEYVALIHEEARWERARQAVSLLADAAGLRDDDLHRQAIELLTERPGGGWEESQDSLYEGLVDRLEGTKGTYLATPFRGLDIALGGGLTPGEVTVVGGWTSHAKSVFATQTGDDLTDRDAEVLYLTNEMRRDEVALRVLAARGGPPFISLRAGQVTKDQWTKVLAAIGKITMSIVDAATRTCEEICAYIASRKPDLAIIDLFNRIPRFSGRTSELDQQVNRICDTASRTGAHIILVSQLNRARLTNSKEFPHPTLGDLRDTGALETHPANVVFTYLTESDGMREGFVEVAKARNGTTGYNQPVVLNSTRMRLVPTTLT